MFRVDTVIHKTLSSYMKTSQVIMVDVPVSEDEELRLYLCANNQSNG